MKGFDDMREAPTQLNEQDLFLNTHIGEWVCLKWREDLFPPPLEKAFGTHLATFIICPHGEEIRGVNFAWLYVDDDNHVYPVGKNLKGIEATWFFKYSTLKKFSCVPLASRDVNFLQLPDLNKEAHAGLTEEIIKIRNDNRLNKFRYAGFPDDVVTTCSPDKGTPPIPEFFGECVWVRLKKQTGESSFQAELLNQPVYSQLKKGQLVTVCLTDSCLECSQLVEP